MCVFAISDDWHLRRVLVQCRNREVRFSPPPCLLSSALRCSSRCGKPRPRRDRISMATATYIYAMRINIIISKSARLGDHALSPLYSLFLFPCSPSARQGTHYFALFLCSLFFSFLFLSLFLSNTRSTIDRLRLYTFPFLLYTVCTRVSSTHVYATRYLEANQASSLEGRREIDGDRRRWQGTGIKKDRYF